MLVRVCLPHPRMSSRYGAYLFPSGEVTKMRARGKKANRDLWATSARLASSSSPCLSRCLSSPLHPLLSSLSALSGSPLSLDFFCLVRLPSWWLKAALSALSVTISGHVCALGACVGVSARVQHRCINTLRRVIAGLEQILIQSYTHTHRVHEIGLWQLWLTLEMLVHCFRLSSRVQAPTCDPVMSNILVRRCRERARADKPTQGTFLKVLYSRGGNYRGLTHSNISFS